MMASDMCRRCGGMQKYINTRLQLVHCDVCKDSHGWDPDAWAREQARRPSPPQAKLEDKKP